VELKLSKEILNKESLSSVKLVKGQKGAFGWEIKVYHKDPLEAYEKCQSINLAMESLYGEVEDTKPEG